MEIINTKRNSKIFFTAGFIFYLAFGIYALAISIFEPSFFGFSTAFLSFALANDKYIDYKNNLEPYI